MKRYLVALVLVMALCIPVSAFALADINTNTNTFIPTNINTPVNTNTNVDTNTNVNTFIPTNLNSNIQGQNQNQGQLQGQGQMQGQIGINAQGQNNDQTIVQKVETPRALLEATPQMINPQINPLIQGGIGDAKDILPNFGTLKYLGSEVVSTVKGSVISYNGWFLNRVCEEDLEEFIIGKLPGVLQEFGVSVERVRYRVLFKPKSKGVGASLQGNGSGSVLPSNGTSPTGFSGGAGGGTGYNSSWVDPTYTVKFYRLK